MFRVVIPARYGSTRLPGKPLLNLAGKPLLQWVYECGRRSSAADVLIATDDERIATSAATYGAAVVMTSAAHVSGTDRIAELARARGWLDDDIVVNLQGDEPLMPPQLIDQVAALLARHRHAGIATLASPIGSVAEFLDPNVVKVVTDHHARALYFSRAPIPWTRQDGTAARTTTDATSQRSFGGARRHIGIYAYRVAALRRLAGLRASPLEELEKLKQLRALENGIEIRVEDASLPPGPDVNTSEDVARVTTLLAARPGVAGGRA